MVYAFLGPTRTGTIARNSWLHHGKRSVWLTLIYFNYLEFSLIQFFFCLAFNYIQLCSVKQINIYLLMPFDQQTIWRLRPQMVCCQVGLFLSIYFQTATRQIHQHQSESNRVSNGAVFNCPLTSNLFAERN